MPSHVAPETPGSIHEGGELGYSLSHAFGAAFDNPELIVACVVGDGESETGPLATGWHAHRFLNPASDGAVLPILHLNGWKIANPALLARIGDDQLDALLRGYGWEPVYVTGDDPAVLHPVMAAAVDGAVARIRAIWERARSGLAAANRSASRPVADDRDAHAQGLDRPEGGRRVAGGGDLAGAPGATARGQDQPRSPQAARGVAALVPAAGAVRRVRCARAELLGLVPAGDQRLGSSPHANGGLLLRDLELPDFRRYAAPVAAPGAHISEPTRVLGKFLRNVMAANLEHRNFRVFGPDETASNRLEAIYEVSGKTWEERTLPVDENLAADGRVMEILSEHTCEGWLEGYLLTGRHGFFSCYEAFIHIVDSMFNQHAKWLKVVTQAGLAAAGRVLELPADLARVAAGPQRVLPPGPWLHRPRGEQEGRGHQGLPAAGREHLAVGGRPLPAQPGLRECDRGGQAADGRLAGHGLGGPALHQGRRDLGVGQHRQRRRRT